MAQPVITFIVNKKPYRLCSSNVDAIRDMPSEDRQQLIALLDAVKREEAAAQGVARTSVPAAATGAVGTNAVSGHQEMQSKKLENTNVDALMAKLILEDKIDYKPGPTKQDVYKWVGIITALIFALMFIA